MSERRRVLLCSFEVFPSPTGGSRRLSAYLPALAERFDVVALTVKLPELSHVERVGEARLLRVPVSSDLLTRIQTYERAVRRQLQSEEYALVHFTGPFGGYPVCEEREKHGYRLIYEAMGFPSQELGFLQPELEKDRRLLSRFRRQELFCLMNADRVLTGSVVTQTFVRSLGVARDAVRVLRTAVDPERLAHPPGPPDGTPLRLLYLGNQAPYQGLATALRALAKTVGRAEVRLRIAGPRHPDWQPQLQELATELRIQDRVDFLAPLAGGELTQLLADSEVGLLPLEASERNREQGGPLAKASDYLGAGRPVLASDLPVTRELLPGNGAVFFPPGNAEILADRMVSLANDVPWRISLGHEALEFAREQLDPARIQAQLLALYQEVLGAEQAGAHPRRPSRPLGPKDETRVVSIPTEPVDKVKTDPAAAPAGEVLPAAPPPRASVGSERVRTLPGKPAPIAPKPVSPAPRLPTPPPEARPSPVFVPPLPIAPGRLPPPPAAPPAGPPAAPPTPAERPRTLSSPLAARPVLPPPPPSLRPAEPARSAPRPGGSTTPAGTDEPEEISSDEILEADAAHASPPALPLPPEGTAPAPVEAHRIETSEDVEPIHEVDEVEAVEEAEAIEEILDADAAVEVPPTIPGGLIDPWLSQILFGYCPPESTHFTRPTPPTNFPGRDEGGPGRSTSSPGTPAHSLSKPVGGV